MNTHTDAIPGFHCRARAPRLGPRDRKPSPSSKKAFRRYFSKDLNEPLSEEDANDLAIRAVRGVRAERR